MSMPQKAIYLVNERSRIFYPDTDLMDIQLLSANGVKVKLCKNGVWKSLTAGPGVPAETPDNGEISVTCEDVGLHTAILQVTHQSNGESSDLQLVCYCLDLNIDVDADRDGIVEENSNGHTWSYGEKGSGAILMVNCVETRHDFLYNRLAQAESRRLLAPIKIRPTGLDTFPDELQMVLAATPMAAKRFCIYRKHEDGYLERVLGHDAFFPKRSDIVISDSLSPQGEDLFAEALEFPGDSFEGLITIDLQLHVATTQPIPTPGIVLKPVQTEERDTLGFNTITSDSFSAFLSEDVAVASAISRTEIAAVKQVVMRVAPWMMNSNLQPVQKVYVCITSPDNEPSEKPLSGPKARSFIAHLKQICDDEQIRLRELTQTEAGGVPFIQDLVEFGYTKSPLETLEVVCGSQVRALLRNLELLGKELGIVQIPGKSDSTLDSFGNLEVSPPVTVRNRRYELGRILFGGCVFGDLIPRRQVTPVLRRFLYGQKVQSPIEIYTDWLAVGHVDEILNFVPAKGEPGFRLLLASPMLARQLLWEARTRGAGQAVLFDGQTRCGEPGKAAITVEALLADKAFWEMNARCQRHMDLNRTILKRELNLSEADIIDVPSLFSDVDPCWTPPMEAPDGRVSAYFPNMVNHLVLPELSVIPMPHGPKVGEIDIFEQDIRTKLESLEGRRVVFLDDWNNYYLHSGDIHCATNTLRRPTSAKWWEYMPDEGFNV